MPLYEYACRTCHHQFELLVRSDTVLECPACHGTTLEKQLSVFAVSNGSAKFNASSAPAGPCGTCGDPRGPGSCSLN